MIKRILAPVLVFVGFGLTASASIAEYCSGSNPACTAFSQTTFISTVSADNPAGPLGFSDSLGVLSGDSYTDNLTEIAFIDYLGGSPNGVMFAASSAFAINTLTLVTAANKVQITVPANYVAVSFSIDVPQGLCDNYCAEGHTSSPLEVDYLNTGDPSAPWVINISPLGAGNVTEIISFDAYSTASQTSDTPEVGTLILIGAGLISMRWMRRAQLHFSGPPQTAC